MKYDKTSIVKLNLKAKNISLLSRKALAKDTLGCNSFPLGRTEKLHLPTIKTHLSIFSEYKTLQLDGDLVIRLDKPNLLILSTRNADVEKMMDDSGLQLRTLKNKYGREVAKGLYASQCAIAGYSFKTVAIGINNKNKTLVHELGQIGAQFFMSPVIFDFNKKKIYIKPAD